MKKVATVILVLIQHVCFGNSGINVDRERAREIRNEIWTQTSEDWNVTVIPEKWENEDAVVIAKSNRLSYRKEAVVANLHYSHFTHYRIKLLSQKAIEEYSEFSVPGTGRYRTLDYRFYAGFKVIKASEEERIIPLTNMVKEKAKLNSLQLDQYKMAVPNLEIGDIIDFYIAEERTIYLSGTKYYSFDPFILELNGQFPVMKQEIVFDVLRRCYINLKSLNGAPEFKLVTDKENDIDRYILVDEDRERLKNIRWLDNYREIPTIKFKITYASKMASNYLPLFIGEPGILKSEVNNKELADFLKYLFTSAGYDPIQIKFLTSMVKYKKFNDRKKLARLAYYYLRYHYHIENGEKTMLNGMNYNSSGGYRFISHLSSYYTSRNIDHDILIGIPKHISSLDDLILENELKYIIRVNEGDEPVYLSYFDANSYYGEIDTDLQGTTVYAVNRKLAKAPWVFKKETLPIESHSENITRSWYNYAIEDLSKRQFILKAKKSIKGAAQDYYQRYLTDFYTYKKEEFDQFRKSGEGDFPATKKKTKEELLKKRIEVMESRDEKFADNLKYMTSSDLDMEIDEIKNFKVEQTGRLDNEPEFIFSYDAIFEGPIKKVGNNYILELGRLIDGQIQLSEEEQERTYNIYMPYARSFDYVLTFDIPDGYSVQGLEKLNVEATNKTGGFTSNARIEENKVIVETEKYYTSNYVDKENWNLMMEFLAAAREFNDAKILLKKE